jgi:hypothetical protein
MAAFLKERFITWSGKPMSRGPYQGRASAVAAPRATAKRPTHAMCLVSDVTVAVCQMTQRSGGSRYTKNGGFVSIPMPATMPAASDQPVRENPSVRARTYKQHATIPVSGRSSWKFVSEETTNGAVDRKKAASRPAEVSSRYRPRRKTLTAPSTRKPHITTCAVSGDTGEKK